MRIGIDISQLAYERTGVANYLGQLLDHLLSIDDKNEYVLFASSLRQSTKYQALRIKYKDKKNVSFKIFKFPPTLLDLLWNKFHVLPIEYLIGDVDIFITSDWTEPPTKKAKKATILYDLIVYKYPEETAEKIVETQKRKLGWVKKESSMVFCISESTKKDAMEILRIDEDKLKVIYPGM
jgi:hypothetical protein